MKTLLLGPVVYLIGLAAIIAASMAVTGALGMVHLSLSEIIPGAAALDDSALLGFFLAAVPAVIAGLLAIPPEGAGRWITAAGNGMLATALLTVPAAIILLYSLPDLLHGSIGEGGLVVWAIGFFAAAQCMSGLGGVLRYGYARRSE